MSAAVKQMNKSVLQICKYILHIVAQEISWNYSRISLTVARENFEKPVLNLLIVRGIIGEFELETTPKTFVEVVQKGMSYEEATEKISYCNIERLPTEKFFLNAFTTRFTTQSKERV